MSLCILKSESTVCWVTF